MANIENEKHVVAKMIALYCSKHHKNALCEECEKLTTYTAARLDRCQHRDAKPKCQNCTSHCYAKTEKIAIRIVMREIGPLILFKMPVATIKYLFRLK